MKMQQHNKSSVRVRFAPSPTGYLHIGGLRTALFNWLFARHHNGMFLIRIEDTDVERSREHYTDSILQSLAWTSIEPDEPIITQSKRIDTHKQIVRQLVADGKAYPCFCSPEDLVERYKAQGQDDFFIKYDGFCRNRTISQEDKDKFYVIRFALPTDRQEVVFDDLIRGRVTFNLNEFDDFIIERSDGRPIYNLVVVLDDAFMKISHVIRGEDHIANTPKQILLYEACGYDIPQFAHLPLILGPSGDRLSKRDAATSVLEYRQEGYLPEALVNYLVRLGWSHGDQEIFTLQEMIEHFSLDHVGKKGAIFDPQKLAWLNGIYIRQESPTVLIACMVKDVQPDLQQQLHRWNQTEVETAVTLYQERVHTLKELADELVTLHSGPKEFDQKDMQKWVTSQTADHMHQVFTLFDTPALFVGDDVVAQLSRAIKELSKKLTIKLIELAQPIRIALIGKSSGPGFFELLAMLGKQESVRRIQALLDAVGR